MKRAVVGAVVVGAVVIIMGVTCGRSPPEEGNLNAGTKAALLERAALYCELSRPIYEANLGNIEAAGRCDGAGFTALHGLMCDYVTLTQFESKAEPGKLCRDAECRCFYGDYGSKSGFSKDMAVMMQLTLSLRPDEGLARRVVDYGVAHNWVVCDAATESDKLGRCLMSLSVIDRWARLAGVALQEGKSEDAIGVNTGFEAHLDMVGVMRDARILGGASKIQRWVIGEQAKRVPQNLLFRALNVRYRDASDAEGVARALLKKFPADRLPTNRDWCAGLLWQRDPSPGDWGPCDGDAVHAGTDYLEAVYALVN